jgi:hypothetical protein
MRCPRVLSFTSSESPRTRRHEWRGRDHSYEEVRHLAKPPGSTTPASPRPATEAEAVLGTYRATAHAARGMPTWRLRRRAGRLNERRDSLSPCALAALKAFCDVLEDRGQPLPRGRRR